MGRRPDPLLFAELINALHDESDALVNNDAARLADAASRREHLLRLLAPRASALRAMRRSGSDELERFALEAAQLAAVDASHVVDQLGTRGAASVSGRITTVRAASSD
jgi:hypothetical protein